MLLALKNVLKLRQHFELISDSFEEEETLLSEEQMMLDMLEVDVQSATQALRRVDDDSFISVLPVSGGQSWQDARSALERNRDELAEYLEQQKIAVATYKHRGLRPCLIFPCSFTSISGSLLWALLTSSSAESRRVITSFLPLNCQVIEQAPCYCCFADRTHPCT